MFVGYKMRKIIFAIVGLLLTSYSIYTWVAFFEKRVVLFENGLAADFFVKHILSLYHLMSITLFILGVVALFTAVFYLKRE